MAKWVNEGENRTLDILLGSQSVDSTLYLRLYYQAAEPAESDGLADISETSGGGYVTIALSRGSWTVTGNSGTYATQTFGPSTEEWQDVYGYYIATTSGDTGKLMAVENFSDGPYAIGGVSEPTKIELTPKITCD